MKSILFVGAFLVLAAQAIPVKDEPKMNDTHTMEPPKHTMKEGGNRMKRDCEATDLDKIQAKVIKALEDHIQKLLEGKLPEHEHNRTLRATSEAAASSKVSPDGTIKTTAAAKGSNDPPAPPPEHPAGGMIEPILTNGHTLPHLDGKPGNEEPVPAGDIDFRNFPGNTDTGMPPPQPMPVPITPVHGADPATHPIAGTGNIVQKVASKANKDSGTSVASAIAKRAAVVQTVDTSGGKAVANAEAHKGADQNVQTVTASGTHVGIANALVDNKNVSGNAMHSGPEVVVQSVAATGEKAVATATNNKGSGSGVQEANAEGEETAIASVVSARVKRGVFHITSDDVSVSTPEEDEDMGSDQKMVMLDRQRQKRSPCISVKFDDNLRHLIEETVEDAFKEVKKEHKL